MKLAATLLAYEWKKDDRKAGEGDIENMKVAFITNFHLFRVGFNLRLQRHIKTLKDPDPKEWTVPLTQKSKDCEAFVTNRCVGKAISDCVEAMIGALYLSATNEYREEKTGETGLYRAFRWLDSIKCIPLKASGILAQVRGIKQSNLGLTMPLYQLNFGEFDRITDVYTKYLGILPQYEEAAVASFATIQIRNLFGNSEIGDFGCFMTHLNHLRGSEFEQAAFTALLPLQTDVLNYKFKNPEILLRSVTHRSAKGHFMLGGDYEKLEALGDAILDYLININMMRYTMFERYLPQPNQPNLSSADQEFLRTYQVNPDYQPGDAHQAKLKLAKNELLAKMACVLGLHRFCLFYDQADCTFTRKDVREYLLYSFTHKDFPMNSRKIEPFETPKVLGDLFESVIGAVYEDGGLDEVHRVFKHLLAPLILFNSQFSKLSALYGEPKEQF